MSFEEGRESFNAAASPVIPQSGGDRDSRNDSELPQPPQPQNENKTEPLSSEARERLQHVLNSDIGLLTLLNRLKQSLSSARDFSSFLKERASVEERHAQALKKLSRGTHELARRPESRGGSFAQAFEESTKIHDRIADNGLQFANSLTQMCNEIQELMSNTERSRKHWKHTGLEAENRVSEAENAMNKAKGRYNNLAEQYDRARTGEKSGGKFGIKGHKSAAQHEEDLHKRLEAADGEYASKVQAAQAARNDLVNTHRPQAVRALQAIIKECDSAIGMQFTKFAGLNERLLLGNGICVSPLKGQGLPGKSLREIARSVDHEKDFHDHVLSYAAKAGQPPQEIRYEKHPTMGSKTQLPQPPPQSFGASQPPQSFGTSQPPPSFNTSQQSQHYGPPQQSSFGTPERTSTGFNDRTNTGFNEPGRPADHSGQITGVMPSNRDGFSGPQQPPYDNKSYTQSPTTTNSPLPQLPPFGSFSNDDDKPDNLPVTRTSTGPQNGPQMGGQTGPQAGLQGRSSMDNSGNTAQPTSGPRTDSTPSFHNRATNSSMAANEPSSRGPSMGLPSDPRPAYSSQQYPSSAEARNPQNGNTGSFPPPTVTSPTTGAAALLPSAQRRTDMNRSNLPPLRPVFGVSLDELFQRDSSAVPTIVYECVKAVDTYGLETEGIYRTSGSAPNIMQMKSQFDHGTSPLPFPLPTPNPQTNNPHRSHLHHPLHTRLLPPRHRLRHHAPQTLPPRPSRPALHRLRLPTIHLRRQDRRRKHPPRLPARHHQQPPRPQLRHPQSPDTALEQSGIARGEESYDESESGGVFGTDAYGWWWWWWWE